MQGPVRTALFTLFLVLPTIVSAQDFEPQKFSSSLEVARPGDRDFQLAFRGRLSPAQTIPMVDSDASGLFSITFKGDLSEARYNLIVFNGMGVTQAHLHCGAAGTAGPVVAFLFGFEAAGVDVDGVLARGSLTNDDILAQDPPVEVCGVTITNIASLLAAMRQDRIYVNVHTLANPPGEVRDQLFSGSVVKLPSEQ